MLDSGHPHRRLRFLLEDTQAKAVLTNSTLAPRLPEPDGWVPLSADVEGEWLPADPDAPLEELADEHSLAYVLYTSGSTGQPKGVLVEHHALTTFILWLGGEFGFGPGDRFAQHMALIFDFAIGEIFAALRTGATLVFVSEEERTEPAAFGELLERERITYLGGLPAVLGSIEVRDLPDLRVIVAGGEALPGEVVNRWRREGRRFIDGYGPTEATVGCVFYDCGHRDWKGQPPIGRPMPRRYAYILDAFGGPCPIGVPGELVIGGLGGAGLARGYLNRPELTAEKFVRDPFGAAPGGRLYRTGDLVKRLHDGRLVFVGRIDRQVKIRGLRIELGEIESALVAHPKVRNAVAEPWTDERDEKHLVAYVSPAPDTKLDLGALRSFLAEHLPTSMLPEYFVSLPELPLTASGKVDRDALPPPEPGKQEGEVSPPRNETERAVVKDIFVPILGVENVGVHDNFFELGGNSLQAAQLISWIKRRFDTQIALADFFRAPTPANIATLVDRQRIAQMDDAELVAFLESLPEEEAARLLAEVPAGETA
jgi:amino acid adenylation domain-containing protein